MSKLEQCSQQKPIKRSTLKQEILQQVNQDMQKIDNLLDVANRMRGVRKIIKQSTKFMKENEDEEKSRNLIWKYDPKYDYQFEQYKESPRLIQKQAELPALEVESRNNWIQQYLDRPNVKLFGKVSGEKVRILWEKNKIISYETNNNQIEQNLLQDQETNSIFLKQFESQNKTIIVQFPANKYIYQFNNSLIQIDLTSYQENEKIAFILSLKHNQNPQSNLIRRVLIFKLETLQLQEQQQQILLSSRGYKKQQYRINEGFYQPSDFQVSIDLSPGFYIFMPFSNTNLSIYTSRKQKFTIIPQQQRKQIKQLNLMLQGFPQCHPHNMKAQFIRQCDFGTGIVIQIYQNLCENQIYFKDIDDKNIGKEDKRLMFRSLYSDRYRSYRLRRGEIIVQFYEVTAKPAVLYQPQKRVFIDKEELYDAKVVHSILK